MVVTGVVALSALTYGLGALVLVLAAGAIAVAAAQRGARPAQTGPVKHPRTPHVEPTAPHQADLHDRLRQLAANLDDDDVNDSYAPPAPAVAPVNRVPKVPTTQPSATSRASTPASTIVPSRASVSGRSTVPDDATRFFGASVDDETSRPSRSSTSDRGVARVADDATRYFGEATVAAVPPTGVTRLFSADELSDDNASAASTAGQTGGLLALPAAHDPEGASPPAGTSPYRDHGRRTA